MFDIAYSTYCSGHALRHRRRHFKDFTYGRQWDEPVLNEENRFVNEADDLRAHGREPLTNNLIHRLVRSIVGRYRAMADADKGFADLYNQPFAAANQLDELDARMFEEYLISGCAIQRVGFDPARPTDVIIDNVSPEAFFVNPHRDPRGRDIDIIGMLHDMPLAEVMARFGQGSRNRARQIADIYAEFDRAQRPSAILGDSIADYDSFHRAPAGRCRVIEVWTLDSDEHLVCHDHREASAYTTQVDSLPDIMSENSRRTDAGEGTIDTAWSLSRHWHCRFYTPTGFLLAHGRSPFAHGGHPFAVKLYPLTDGEVHPFVEDICDQQRYINRLISAIDHIMRVSAKGVLLYPMDQLPENYTWQDLTRMWAAADGLIPVRDSSGVLPHQEVTSGADNGAYRLLELQMKLFEDTSGVTDALMGNNPGGNTGADLYRARLENATTSLLDIFASFRAFIRQRNALANNCQ